MKTAIKYFIIGMILLSNAFSNNLSAKDFDKNIVESLFLKTSDLPAGYKLNDKDLAITTQASLLYKDSDLYLGVFKLNLIKKSFQSVASSEDKGTIFIYILQESADALHPFSEGFIWGSAVSSDEHPEEIISKDNMMIVLSFKKDSKIKELYKSKIQEIIK